MLSGGVGPNAAHQLVDNESNLIIPSDLVTMERFGETTYECKIRFMTSHIAMIIAEVQEQNSWAYDRETLNVFFRSHETRVAVGTQCQKMFLRKFQRQDPDTIPPCYELGKTKLLYPLSRLRKEAEAPMPWKGLGQQPELDWPVWGHIPERCPWRLIGRRDAGVSSEVKRAPAGVGSRHRE